jgi:hypothetical protein
MKPLNLLLWHLLALALAGLACDGIHDPSQDGNLVPKTVDEDPTLPSLELAVGHYARSWFAAGEGGFDRSWLTYIKNSDYYRTNIYAGAKDGWYSGTAGAFHAGAKAGFRLSSVEVVARAGVNKTETLADLTVPFYAMVGANYRF